jgi:hypothetical protein
MIENKYFSISQKYLANRKTPIYEIYSKLSNTLIGEIKWYGAWRQFCFFPVENTVWDTKCLTSLTNYIQAINCKYKHSKENGSE